MKVWTGRTAGRRPKADHPDGRHRPPARPVYTLWHLLVLCPRKAEMAKTCGGALGPLPLPLRIKRDVGVFWGSKDAALLRQLR